MIEAADLHKAFGATRAVDGLSMTVRPGEAYGLVGPDGAGKTTTLRLLVGALTPDRGRVRIGGYDLRTQVEQARARVGYLAQRFSLYGDLTVAENLHFFGQVRGVQGQALRRRTAELLAFVGLAGFEQRRAEVLSGGMKQKLGLACALIHQPQVLLLDEPTGGVDPITRQDFWQLIIRVLAEGAAVIVSTPYMDEAARCGRLGFMHAGRLLTEGSPRALTQPLAGRVVELAARPKATARAVALADPEVEDVTAFGDRFHLRVRAPAGPLERLPQALAAAGAEVERLRLAAPSLEDVFIALLQQQAARPVRE
jgi:ABC-2 type transport system ATP-binding protein